MQLFHRHKMKFNHLNIAKDCKIQNSKNLAQEVLLKKIKFKLYIISLCLVSKEKKIYIFTQA
jgi:hypothetical protein